MFSSKLSFERMMSVGVALKSFIACGVGIQSEVQSATVSVSQTKRRQIGLSIASIGQPAGAFSQSTSSISFHIGSLSVRASSGVFLRLKYCVPGISTSGVIPGYTA